MTVRTSLMTFQGFDLYRADNSGALRLPYPLTARPDSKWIGNLASGGLGKSQTIRVTSAYSSSLSIADVRESEDVGGMIFEVTPSEASADVKTVDWTPSTDTTETPTDVPGGVRHAYVPSRRDCPEAHGDYRE